MASHHRFSASKRCFSNLWMTSLIHGPFLILSYCMLHCFYSVKIAYFSSVVLFIESLHCFQWNSLCSSSASLIYPLFCCLPLFSSVSMCFEVKFHLNHICLCKSNFLSGTRALTQMVGVMLRTPRWYSEIYESYFSRRVTVQSCIFHLPWCDSEKSLTKSSETGNTFSLKLFLCLVFIPGLKLVSCVFSLNMETLREDYLMGLKKITSNEEISLKDTLLIWFLFNCPSVCVYVRIGLRACVCVLICSCLSESEATWVHFLDCASKHFIDTHSSSQCIDFPLVDDVWVYRRRCRGKMSSFFLFCLQRPHHSLLPLSKKIARK